MADENNTEQHTDDYDALASRIDDLFAKIDALNDNVGEMKSAINVFLDNFKNDDADDADDDADDADDDADDTDLETPIEELDLSL